MSFPFLQDQRRIFIQQQKEWSEILTGWETRNQYAVQTERGESVGCIVERGRGFLAQLARLFLRSHRNFNITIADTQGSVLAVCVRPFHWFFSELSITGPKLNHIGLVRQRFGIFYFRYDLHDQSGRLFARVERPLWRVWTLPVVGIDPRKRAIIAKKWGGLLKELLTDADKFGVDFGDSPWSDNERAVIFATAISIDLDAFEENHVSAFELLRIGASG